MVAKRSLSHWRLLSAVVIGVLLASAIMAGTVIYFDALRELALKNMLSKYTTTELDITIRGQWGPITDEEYRNVTNVVNEQVQAHVAWMVTDRERTAKTPTFFLSTSDNEDSMVVRKAGDDNARAYFAFLSGLEQETTLLPGGSTPKEQLLSPPGGPLVLEAMIPLEAARLFRVGVGDRMVVVPPWQDLVPYVTVVISGVFERNVPTDDFWFLEESVLNAATGPSFRTVPFYISEKSFTEVLGPSFSRMEGTFAWHLMVDIGRVNTWNSALTLANVQAMHENLSVSLSSYRQTTVIDDALREYDRRIFFSKFSMFVVLILIDIVILYYVATLSSLVVEERRSEVALLRSRGATSAQILTVFVLEGTTIALLAVLAGPLLAAGAISVLGFTPAFSDLTGGARLVVNISTVSYMMGALGGALSFIALIVPAVRASRIGVTRYRQEAARPSTLPAFQRYYLDVFALLISIFLFRQLTEQGSVVATTVFGEVVVNQLLLALPGLMLVAAAMVLLRLFPLVMNLASRLLSAWLPAGLVLGVWQMARNPTHYARLSLLLILTAGLGIFAASFGATLQRSFQERVLYATGGDITVDGGRLIVRCIYGGYYSCKTEDSGKALTLMEAYETIPGVDRASPVLESQGRDLTKAFGASFAVIAVDGDSFGEVAFFRDDFSDRPMADLLDSLSVSDSIRGIVLPYGAGSISVRLKADRPHPGVIVTARVRNAMGEYHTYNLGTLDTADWAVLSTSLRFGRGVQSSVSSRPLELVSLRVHESRGAARLQAGSILIDRIQVKGDLPGISIIEDFDNAASWSVLKVASEAMSDVLRPSSLKFDGDDSRSVLFSWTEGSPLTARGIFHGQGPSPLPILTSKSLAKAMGHNRGDEFEVSISGHRVPVRLLDTIDMFPTMTIPNQKFLVADLASLTRYANLGAISRELASDQVWISSETSGAERGRLVDRLQSSQDFTSGAVLSREKRLAESQADPLVAAGWRALLFIAFTAVLILSCLGFTVHAYVSFRNRRLEFALLRTVGISMKQLITMVWLEQILVIAVGMALGTWLGGRLAGIIMPFLGHDDWGAMVMPPFAMQVNWGALLITYSVMVLVFSAIVLGIIWLIHKISLQHILRLGEM